MKSRWKVNSIPIDLSTKRMVYQVYRLREPEKPHYCGNEETYGGLFDSESDALELAELLNSKE